MAKLLSILFCIHLFLPRVPVLTLCACVCVCACAGERGQGDAAGGGAAPETGQHATAGGEPDGSGAAQEVHRVVLSQHRQETLRQMEKERERRPPLLLL